MTRDSDKCPVCLARLAVAQAFSLAAGSGPDLAQAASADIRSSSLSRHVTSRASVTRTVRVGVGHNEREGDGVSLVRRCLFAVFGVRPVREMRNKVVLGRGAWAMRRLEDAEVARLDTTSRLSADVVTVVATFRRPELLAQAVRSALAQTYADHAVIVVDDGGGIDAALPSDPRLRVVSLSRNTRTAGVVRNVGIRLTESRVLAFLDDDNTWRPDHLATAVAEIDDGAELVYTGVQVKRDDGSQARVLSEPFDRKRLRAEALVDTNAIVVQRTPRVRYSRLPRTVTTTPREDWELVHRLSRRMDVRHVDRITVDYLAHRDSYYTDWSADPS